MRGVGRTGGEEVVEVAFRGGEGGRGADVGVRFSGGFGVRRRSDRS